MSNSPPGPSSIFQRDDIVASIAAALPSNKDATAFLRVNRLTHRAVTPTIWRVIPSAWPLLQLFSSLHPVGRLWVTLEGPLPDCEVVRFQGYARHVVQIEVLYDSISGQGRYVHDISKALDIVAVYLGHNVSVFPKLKTIGISNKFSIIQSLANSAIIPLSQISSLALAVREIGVSNMAGLIRECGPTLQRLSITGDSILNPRIVASVALLTRLEAIYIDMSELEGEWGPDILRWKMFVLALSKTLDVVHISSPPASPSIVSAFLGRRMQYIHIATLITSFCAFLPAVERIADTPTILRVQGYEDRAVHLEKAISLAGLRMDVHVFQNVAVIRTSEVHHLKRPFISTRNSVRDVSYEWKEMSSLCARSDF